MKKNRFIPLKAVFLLVVFLLNTVISLACTAGLEPGHDPLLHHASERHFHKHDHADSDHHDLSANQHSAKKDKENCCKDELTKLLKEDKLASSKSAVNLQPTFFITVPTSFYQLDDPAFPISGSNTRYFLSSHHPPIRDIRISIQSFQI